MVARRKVAKRKTAKPAASGGAAARRQAVKRAQASGRAWLVKTEPDVYSIDDLSRDGHTMWDGVRNYQARNLMRDQMAVGDPVLIYHSNAKPMAIVGLAEVCSETYADPTAFDSQDSHFDPKSDPGAPTWFLVDVAHCWSFAEPLDRDQLKGMDALEDMMLLRRGSRLSVQPVTPEELGAVLERAAGG